MSLNIKDKEVERLIEEVSLLTGESKTEAVRGHLAALGVAAVPGDPVDARGLHFIHHRVNPLAQDAVDPDLHRSPISERIGDPSACVEGIRVVGRQVCDQWQFTDISDGCRAERERPRSGLESGQFRRQALLYTLAAEIESTAIS